MKTKVNLHTKISTILIFMVIFTVIGFMQISRINSDLYAENYTSELDKFTAIRIHHLTRMAMENLSEIGLRLRIHSLKGDIPSDSEIIKDTRTQLSKAEQAIKILRFDIADTLNNGRNSSFSDDKIIREISSLHESVKKLQAIFGETVPNISVTIPDNVNSLYGDIVVNLTNIAKMSESSIISTSFKSIHLYKTSADRLLATALLAVMIVTILSILAYRLYSRMITETELLQKELIDRNDDYSDKYQKELFSLIESERQWNSAFNAIGSPMFLHDENGHIIKANKAYLTCAGKRLAEIIGKPYWNVFPVSEVAFPICREPSDDTSEIVLTHNSRKFLSQSFAVPKTDELSSYDMHLLTDVTEKIEMTSGLRRYQQIISTDADMIAFIDQKFRFITVNNSFASLFGKSTSDLLGASVSSIAKGSNYEFLVTNLLAEALDGYQQRFQCETIMPNGAKRWLEVSLVPYTNSEAQIVGVVSRTADITDVKLASLKLEYQAHHDPVTRLPNRLLLKSRLQKAINLAIQQCHQGALLYIDIDNFKHVNDSLGHSSGDQILTDIAKRVRKASQADDIIAHISGDEFIIVINDVCSKQEVLARVDQISSAIREPFLISNHEICLTSSVGIAMFPAHGDSVESLIKNGDSAMYRSKRNGKDQATMYSEEFSRAAMERITLESNMRKALERNEFVLHYQPQICLKTNTIIAFEALVRWQHPEQGMVPPNCFIPLAEETGLIVPIGEWVMETACKQIVEWKQQFPNLKRIAVNLSGVQIQQKGLPETVKKVLQRTGCDPSLLELEITENFIMSNPEQTIKTMTKIRDLGVALAIDDFGTGQSSLNYLKRLPVSRLKIDRSFVSDINGTTDQPIISAILALGTSMKMEVTAEGIETEIQKDFLSEHKCPEAQGYLFSRPLSSQDATAFLSAKTALISGIEKLAS